MLKMQLPLFPPELTFINRQISFQKKDGKVYYFHGLLPLFSHEESDIKSFRLITSELVVSGNVKLIEIAKAFGVTYISVKRSVKLLREEGPEGFFNQEAKARKPHVLTGEVVEKVQGYLDKGYSPSEIAGKLNLKANTIRKAIQAGRLRKKNKIVQQRMNRGRLNRSQRRRQKSHRQKSYRQKSHRQRRRRQKVSEICLIVRQGWAWPVPVRTIG
jgi:predicted DNA-binding protein YlxM (UPF0122 family)